MMVGIVGGGQLGRMLVLAGLPMGMKFRVLDPSRSSSAGCLAEHVVGEYDDHAALADFVAGLDVVTYEFENVPVSTAKWLQERVPVYPPPAALHDAQDRIAEKAFFQSLNIPTPRFAPIDSENDMISAVNQIGLPAVLKTRRFGYDGKGQMILRDSDDLNTAWLRLGGRPLIFEELIPFQRELSLLAVRSIDGKIASYPLIENTHRGGILRQSVAPFENSSLQRMAEQYGHIALNRLNYVGVLAIEFFHVADQLLVNEMAPRVHNSGHWTIEGATTSQFANHLRAITGLPLGETRATHDSAMVNLIGTMPKPSLVLEVPGTSLHDYGKAARPNRKLGHITVTAPNRTELNSRLAAINRILQL